MAAMNSRRLRLASVLAILPVTASVVSVPAPSDEPLSPDYEVVAGGQPVAVYTARTLDPPFAGKEWDFGGPYAFANFTTDGPVEVRVTSRRSLRDTVIRPARPDVAMRLDPAGVLVVSLPGPRKLSLEPEGKQGPLLLFANPPEPNPPKPDAPGVIYFGPGVHRPGRIEVTNHQTLYLAAGAVVKGGVVAQGEHMRITDCFIRTDDDCVALKGLELRAPNSNVERITVEDSILWCDRARIFLLGHESRAPFMRGITLRNLDIIHFTMTPFLFEPGEEMRLSGRTSGGGLGTFAGRRTGGGGAVRRRDGRRRKAVIAQPTTR